MSKIETLAKIANLPKILEAAQLLFKHGLLTERPESLVKIYVEDNPDINEYLNNVPLTPQNRPPIGSE